MFVVFLRKPDLFKHVDVCVRCPIVSVLRCFADVVVHATRCCRPSGSGEIPLRKVSQLALGELDRPNGGGTGYLGIGIASRGEDRKITREHEKPQWRLCSLGLLVVGLSI